MSKKWKIYCINEGEYQFVWSETAPTTCPNNASHSVDLTKEINVISGEEITMTIVPRVNSFKNSNWSRIAVFSHDPKITGIIHRIQLIGHMDSGITSFDCELFNLTNNQSLIQTTFTATTPDSILFSGIISNPPTTNVVLEVNCKKNGGSANSKFYIEQILIFTY